MQKIKLVCTFIVLVLQAVNNFSFSQCSISAKVTDSLKTPIPFITIALLKEDSTIYKGEITGENGEFCFSKVNKGTYLVKISAIGYVFNVRPKCTSLV